MLGRVRFGPHQAKDHIRLLGGAGPDLLPVDHEIAIFDPGAGLESGEVRSGPGLRIPLTPDYLAFEGWLDPFPFLGFGSEFQQCWNEHGDSLVRKASGYPGARKFLGDDPGFKNVRLGPVSAVLLGDSARGISMLDQQLLPCNGFGGWSCGAALSTGCTVTMGLKELTHFLAKRVISGSVVEVHFGLSLGGRSSGRPKYRQAKIVRDWFEIERDRQIECELVMRAIDQPRGHSYTLLQFHYCGDEGNLGGECGMQGLMGHRPGKQRASAAAALPRPFG